MQRDLNVTWDVDLYGELLKIGGGKERYTIKIAFTIPNLELVSRLNEIGVALFW